MFWNKLSVFLLILSSTLSSMPLVEPARILGVFNLYARSHHQFIQPLMASLAEAGHEVVVYSYFPHANPPVNYTDVYLGDMPTWDSRVNKLILDTLRLPHWKNFDLFFASAPQVFEGFIKNKKIQELIQSKEHFDLIISETFAMQEFTLIFSHIFKAPVIGIQSFVTSKILNRNIGNSLSLSYIPDSGLSFPSTMTFMERTLNTVFSLRALWYVYDYQYLSFINSKIKEHFPEMPDIYDLMDDVALVFVNDHLTADYAQPRTPNLIPVAGIHIGESQPLPSDLQKFMDEAQNGVIYFSLGTYVPDNLRPKEYFSMFSQVFRQLKQRVLWKTRKEDIQDLPDNVKITKWLPQRDVLAHPKCVLFLTHGGLLSQHETIHSGVPVVVIPHVFDQHRNAKLIQEKGVGISLDLNNLTYQGVLDAIREVLYDQKYKTNIMKLSNVFRDRPLSPRATVVYWTEYVLKHGAAHLQPASKLLAWYQLALWDVLAVLLLIIAATVIVLYVILRTILIITCTRKKLVKEKTK